MSVDRSLIARNDAERERLRALVTRLSEEELRRPVGEGWTVAATLAHLAYWDRRSLARIEQWEREGVRVSPLDPNPINEAMLPQWLAMPLSEAAREALAAAEAVDQKVAGLAPEVMAAILAARPRTAERAVHRREHLDQMEQVLTS